MLRIASSRADTDVKLVGTAHIKVNENQLMRPKDASERGVPKEAVPFH
jgi:hypothetical protein